MLLLPATARVWIAVEEVHMPSSAVQSKTQSSGIKQIFLPFQINQTIFPFASHQLVSIHIELGIWMIQYA